MTPPPVPTEEAPAKDAGEKREGKTERPKREPEEVPDMTVEEAHKALNALPKVCVCGANIFFSHFSVLFSFEAEQAFPCRCICICICSFVWRSLRWSCAMVRRDSAGRICDTQQQEKKLTSGAFLFLRVWGGCSSCGPRKRKRFYACAHLPRVLLSVLLDNDQSTATKSSIASSHSLVLLLRCCP